MIVVAAYRSRQALDPDLHRGSDSIGPQDLECSSEDATAR